jgi:hypothetical protein
MTVPIYCVSLFFVIFTAFTSDYTKDRAWHLVGLSLFAVMSLAIVAGVSNAHVRYAFLALGKSTRLAYEAGHDRGAGMRSEGGGPISGTWAERRRDENGHRDTVSAGTDKLTLTGWGGIQSCVLLNFAYMGNSFGRPAEKRAVAIGLIK